MSSIKTINRTRTLSGKCPNDGTILGDRQTAVGKRFKFCPACGKPNPWLALYWMATMPDGNHAFIAEDNSWVDLERFFQEAIQSNGALRFELVDYGSLPSLEGM